MFSIHDIYGENVCLWEGGGRGGLELISISFEFGMTLSALELCLIRTLLPYFFRYKTRELLFHSKI